MIPAPPMTRAAFDLELVWYVLTARYMTEATAEANLRRRGFTAWAPMKKSIVSHAGSRREEARPLLPGYLFVGLTDHQSVGNALRVHPVQGCIRMAGNVMAISMARVAALWIGLEPYGGMAPLPTDPKIGTRVRVAGGLLATLQPNQWITGIVEARDGKSALKILLDDGPNFAVTIQTQDLVVLG